MTHEPNGNRARRLGDGAPPVGFAQRTPQSGPSRLCDDNHITQLSLNICIEYTIILLWRRRWCFERSGPSPSSETPYLRQRLAHAPQFPRRVQRSWVFMSCLATLAGCTDRPLATSLRAPDSALRSTSLSGADTTWNHVSFTVRTTRDASAGLSARSGPTPSTTILLEKWLENGAWRTNVSIEPGAPGSDGSGIVHTIMFDSQGAITGATDAHGNTVSLTRNRTAHRTPAELAKLAAAIAGETPATRQVAGLAVRSKQNAAASKAPVDPRLWIDQLVVTPAARGRALARLARWYGTPADRSGNVDHYRAARNGLVDDQFFDNTIGAVVEQSLSDGAHVHTHVVKQFVRMDDGRYVLQRVHTDYPAADGSMTGFTQDFANVSVGGV